MKLSIQELKETLENIAIKYVSAEEAKYYSEEISEAYIRKYPRSNVLKDEVLNDLKRQEQYKEHTIEVIKDLPSLLQLDFHNLPMTFKIKWIHDSLIKKAKETGIAMLAFDNSGGMHSLHTWSQGLAKRGYFTFGAYNGGPFGVVPLNGTHGLLGTNPITYAFPTENENVVIDMATSQIPFFEIRNCKKNNIPLKENSAVDTNGKPTLDPNEALSDSGVSNILPMGANYRGYAINYLIEIMTGALVGAKLSSEQDPNYSNEDHGGFLLVFDINALTNIENFKKSVTDFNKIIRSQKPADGTKVIVPGDNNYNRLLNAQKEKCVEVDNDVWEEIKHTMLI